MMKIANDSFLSHSVLCLPLEVESHFAFFSVKTANLSRALQLRIHTADKPVLTLKADSLAVLNRKALFLETNCT